MGKNNKKHTWNTFWLWYNRIKNNLPILILVPTLVGGLWQVFSLWSLGFEFIRFFSITQLVADGLLMIILIPITAIFPIMVYFIIKSFRDGLIKKKSPSFFSLLFFSILTVGVLGFLSYYYLGYVSSLFKDKPSFFIELLSFLLFIPLIESSVLICNKLFEKLESYSRLIKRSYNSFLWLLWRNILDGFNLVFVFACYIIAMFSIVSTLIAFFGIIGSLGSYFISDNLANTKNIERIMARQYQLDPEDYTIKYFNDTYIFIEHPTVTGQEKKKSKKEDKSIPREIIILKFDALFDLE